MKTHVISTEMNIPRTILVKYLLSTMLLDSVTLQNCCPQFCNIFQQGCNNLLTLEIEHCYCVVVTRCNLMVCFLVSPGDIGKLIKLSVVCHSYYKLIYSVSGLG